MEKLKVWFRAARPFSFTVSVVPPMLGAILAPIENRGLVLNWVNLLLTVIGCFTAHAASNILSDYFDFKNNVDRKGTYGSSGVLVQGLVTPKSSLFAAAILFSFAALMGILLIFLVPNGKDLLFLILAGGFLGLFYTSSPFVFKYVALGDLAVFLAFGPLMVLGSYFVQAGYYSWTPIFYSIPIALLVDAVLHSNNLRDIESDKVCDIKTFAMMIGVNNAKRFYYLLLAGSYFFTIIFVVTGFFTPWTLLVLVSSPVAIQLIRRVSLKEQYLPSDFADIDARTAKLHSLFSILLLIGLLISYFL